MRKITTLFFVLCILSTYPMYAQNNTSSSKFEGRPMPDWIMGATPEPSDNSYYYKVFESAHADREEARNQAIKKAFQQAITYIDATVNSSEVFAAVERGGNLNVLSDTYHIPIYFTCEFSKKTPDGSQWVYWILCQIAKRGNIAPLFDTHFTDCNTHEIWDKKKEEEEHKVKATEIRSNARALVASTFIPGMGQMLKKQGGSGAAFLVSEVALFGGGTACYFLGQEQLKTMKAAGTSYNNYKEAKDMKGTLDIAMYTCFGVGIAVHIANMVHAWYVKDKHLPVNVAFVPAVIPTNELSTPSFATGAGIQVTF